MTKNSLFIFIIFQELQNITCAQNRKPEQRILNGYHILYYTLDFFHHSQLLNGNDLFYYSRWNQPSTLGIAHDDLTAIQEPNLNAKATSIVSSCSCSSRCNMLEGDSSSPVLSLLHSLSRICNTLNAFSLFHFSKIFPLIPRLLYLFGSTIVTSLPNNHFTHFPQFCINRLYQPLL